MDVFTLCAIVLLVLLCLGLLHHFALKTLAIERRQGWIHRNLVVARLFDNGHFDTPTRLDALCYLAHCSGICFLETYRVKTRDDLALRAGQLCVVHIVPLMVSQLSFAGHMFGLSRKTITKFHAAFGLMALAQAILHGTLHWVKDGRRSTQFATQFALEVTVREYTGPARDVPC